MTSPTEKVIFDTNPVKCDRSSDCFLGGRNEIKQFAKIADLFFPEIVIEEIREQKRRLLSEKRDSFLGNIFHKLRGVDEADTQNFDIESFIAEQEKNETVSYSVIGLSDFSVLPQMKDMALRKSPPFNKGKKDEGFKDAYIYFSILEFLKSIPDERIFFVTRDDRLRDAFAENPRIQVVEDFNDFQHYRTAYFREPYFIEKLQEVIGENIEPSGIQDIWLNLISNWVLKVNVNVGTDEDPAVITFRIEVDFASREVIGYIIEERDDLDTNIQRLISSNAFRETRDSIEGLTLLLPYFTDDEVIKIADAFLQNDQIYAIAENDDVKQFFMSIWDGKKDILPSGSRDFMKQKYNFPDD